MTKFKLEIVPGTTEIVENELKGKFPNVSILSKTKQFIEFESEENDIDTFRVLLSPLRIQKENGLERNLFRRDWKKATSPASINPALAYILCSLAEVNEDDIVYDPFCGSGTIGLSAYLYFSPKKVLCSDLSGKAVDWINENAKSASVDKKKFIVFRSNISQIKLQANSVNKIISNLPFGIRVGDHAKNMQLYEHIFRKAKNILQQDGLLVLYTVEKKLIEDLSKKHGFVIEKELLIEQGKLYPSIFVIRKKK